MYQFKHLFIITAALFLSACNLTVENSGSGVVISDDQRINCGESCIADYTNQASVNVTLEALPDEGYIFDGWEGACEGLEECVVAMGATSGNKQVVANFRRDLSIIKQPMDITNSRSCAIEGNDVVCWYPAYDDKEIVLAGLSNPVSVATNWDNTCAIDDSGIVCAIEDNANLDHLIDPIALSAGDRHFCAIDAFLDYEHGISGVYCRESGTSASSIVTGVGDKAKEVAVGNAHGCVISATDGVVCWGYNNGGFSSPLNAPEGLINPKGIDAQDDRTCVITDSGVVCWRYSFGELQLLEVPETIDNPQMVSVGAFNACALDNAEIVCWGDNSFGQSDVPGHLSNPYYVKAGYAHACALDDNGVVCWGKPDAAF